MVCYFILNTCLTSPLTNNTCLQYDSWFPTKFAHLYYDVLACLKLDNWLIVSINLIDSFDSKTAGTQSYWFPTSLLEKAFFSIHSSTRIRRQIPPKGKFAPGPQRHLGHLCSVPSRFTTQQSTIGRNLRK
ncbi:MAG: hypothetical protein ACI90V_001131 [Bacillariaceae sp.]|jgi:hypothetical protein